MKQSTSRLIIHNCRVIFLFGLLLVPWAGHSQNGITCQNAIPLVAQSECQMSTHTFSNGSPNLWFEIQPTTSTIGISVNSYGETNPAYIHGITVRSGSSSFCTALGTPVYSWQLPPSPFEFDEVGAHVIENLIPGQSYLVILERGLPSNCGKGCAPNDETFKICAKSLPYFDELAELVCPPDPVYDPCNMVANGQFDSLYSYTGNHLIDTATGQSVWYQWTVNQFAQELICYWNQGWGTPDLYGEVGPSGWADSENFAAQMWASSGPSTNPIHGNSPPIVNWSEGVAQPLAQPVYPNKNYLLRYKARNYVSPFWNNYLLPNQTSSTLDSWFFSLSTTASSPWPGLGANYWEMPPTGTFSNQSIDTGYNLPVDTTWQVFGACFTPNAIYDELFFYPIHNDTSTWAILHVDDVELVEFPIVGESLLYACSDSVMLNECDGIDGATYSWSPTTGLSDPTIANPLAAPTQATWYVCTATIVLGGDTCVVQDSVAVEPWLNSVNLQASSTTLCPNSAITITASGALASGFLWSSSPVDPSLVGQQNNATITVTPTVQTTYYVEFYGVDSCFFMDSITIDVLSSSPEPMIVGAPTMCCEIADYSVDSIYSTYSWNTVPAMLFQGSNTNTATIDWSAAMSDTVFVTVMVTDSNGCEGVDSFMVTNDCCVQSDFVPTGSSIISIGDCSSITYASDLVALYGGVLATNQYVLIDNLLVIDVPYSIVNCPNVRMGANAKIEVNPGVNFSLLNNTIIGGCPDQMWDGIYVADSTAQITMRNNEVWDAENTVVINNDARYLIENNQFTNNGIGVKVNPYFGVVGATSIQFLKNNTFESFRGQLKAPYDVAPQDNALAGIEVNQVGRFRVRNENFYRGLDNGVLLYQSEGIVQAQRMFDLINPDPAVYGQNIGIGVHSIGQQGPFAPHYGILVGGQAAGSPRPNYFTNVHWGIKVIDNVDLIAKFNELEGVELVGIYAGFSRLGEHIINGNTINGNNGIIGINCYSNRLTDLKVKNNFINWNRPATESFFSGVVIENVIPNANPTDMDIASNQVMNCRKGLVATNMPYIKLRGNQVRIEKTNIELANQGVFYMGLNVNASNNAEITRNRVLRTVDLPDTLTAPLIKGILIENTLGAFVQKNETRQIGEGIHVYGANNGTDYLCNKFRFHWNGFVFDNADVFAAFPPGTNTDNKWFDDLGYYRLSGQVLLSNPVRNWYFDPNGGARQPSPFQLPLLDGIAFVPQTQALSGCQTVIGPDGPDIQVRTVQFEAIVQDDKTLNAFEPEVKYYDQMYTVSTFGADNGWLNLGTFDDADYQSFYNACMGENLGSFCQVSSKLSQGDYAAASAINGGISCNSVQEQYSKDVNEIYLATFAVGNMEYTPQQLADLEFIACQDGLIGGPAVYAARVMLGSDYQCANGAKNLQAKTEKAVASSALQLYPNPTQGQVTVDLGQVYHSNITIEVIDLSGRVLQVETVQSGDSKINLNLGLPSGVYLIKVRQGDQTLGNLRLTLV